MVINHVRKKEETGGEFASAAQKKKDRKIPRIFPRNWQAFINNVLSACLVNLLHMAHIMQAVQILIYFNIFTVLFHLIIYSNGFLVASICVSS